MKSVLDKEDETSRRQIDSEALEHRLSSLSPLKNMLKPRSSLAAHVSALALSSHIMHQKDREYTQ